MAIKITKISDNSFMEDEKKPFNLITEVKYIKEDKKYLVKVLHPNLNIEGKRDTVFEELIEAKNFDEAMKFANDKKDQLASIIVTRYEEIKYIRNGKKGSVKLKLKQPEEEVVVEAEIEEVVAEAELDDDELEDEVEDEVIEKKKVKNKKIKKVKAVVKEKKKDKSKINNKKTKKVNKKSKSK